MASSLLTVWEAGSPRSRLSQCLVVSGGGPLLAVDAVLSLTSQGLCLVPAQWVGGEREMGAGTSCHCSHTTAQEAAPSHDLV